MKSQVPVFFNDWLTLMETAFSTLTKEQFRELEEKIKKEIAFYRLRKPSNVPHIFKNGRCTVCEINFTPWDNVEGHCVKNNAI
jgi:hypothetical protein